uniref:Apolipoprotein D n=1 Tax=Culicoides sonorensis TaxID=179676 RepID=A0A336KKD8_CULSO
MVKILLFSALIALASAQIPSTEVCPEYPVQQDFSAADYLGIWFENAKYPFIFEALGKCTTAEYTLRPDGNVGVFNRQINRLTGSLVTIEGYAVPDPNEPAKLGVIFPGQPGNRVAPYWVLETDYLNYSVVWACENVEEGSLRFVYILTRERQPSEEIYQTALSALERNEIPTSFLRKTNQVNCPDI